MSRTIILTDEQYAVLASAAADHDQTPEDVLAQWIEVERVRNLLRSPQFEALRHKRMRLMKDDPNATQPSVDHPAPVGRDTHRRRRATEEIAGMERAPAHAPSSARIERLSSGYGSR